MNAGYLHVACDGLKAYYHNADQCEKAVIETAIGAAATAALLGMIPTVGPEIASALAGGVVLSMYIRINKLLELKAAKVILKSIISVLLSELAASITVSIILSTVLSLIPGIGSLGAGVGTAITEFCFVYICGILYIQILTKLAKSGKNLDTLTEEEVKQFAKENMDEDTVKKYTKEAMKEATHNLKNIKRATTHCPNCDAPRTKDDKFCTNCGTQFIFDEE